MPRHTGASTPDTQVLDTQRVIHAPIDNVVPSPTNPRKRFDEEKLLELAESVKLHGVLQPIVVRSVDHKYEVIAGERRFRASKLAGVATVPVLVREMDDKTVLEVQIIENLQRSDLHPMEEAEGYQRLKDAGYTATAIGEKIGKTKSYVNKTIVLLKLSAKLRAAFLEDKFDRTTALELARNVTPEEQDRCFRDIEHMNPKRVGQYVLEHYTLKLSDAPFDKDSADLVAECGPCTTCPKRTKNQQDLFDDIGKTDRCTDRACWKAKVEAHWALTKAAAKETGQTVLEGNAADRARYSSKYVRGDNRAWESRKHGANTWDTLLKKAVKAEEIQPVLIRDRHGDIEALYPKDAALKAIGEKPEARQTTSDNDYQRQLTVKIKTAAAAEAVPQLLAGFRNLKPFEQARLLAQSAYDHTSIDAHGFTAKRMGLVESQTDARRALERWLKDKERTQAELNDFTVELLLCQPGVSTYGPSYNAVFSRLAKEAKVNLGAIERRMRAERKAKKKPAAKVKAKSAAAVMQQGMDEQTAAAKAMGKRIEKKGRTLTQEQAASRRAQEAVGNGFAGIDRRRWEWYAAVATSPAGCVSPAEAGIAPAPGWHVTIQVAKLPSDHKPQQLQRWVSGHIFQPAPGKRGAAVMFDYDNLHADSVAFLSPSEAFGNQLGKALAWGERLKLSKSGRDKLVAWGQLRGRELEGTRAELVAENIPTEEVADADGWNEHGVHLKPRRYTCPLPKGMVLAVTTTQLPASTGPQRWKQWTTGYEFQFRDRGCSGPCRQNVTADSVDHDTEADAFKFRAKQGLKFFREDLKTEKHSLDAIEAWIERVHKNISSLEQLKTDVGPSAPAVGKATHKIVALTRSTGAGYRATLFLGRVGGTDAWGWTIESDKTDSQVAPITGGHACTSQAEAIRDGSQHLLEAMTKLGVPPRLVAKARARLLPVNLEATV